MRRPALIVTLLLAGLMLGRAGLTLAESELSKTLIGSARLWEQKHRSDLARSALQKLLTVEPDNARGLLQLGMVELRASQVDAAKAVLKTMQRQLPDAPQTRMLQEALRVETTDRLRMAKARFLARSARADAAAEAMREAFPHGPPAGDLGVEYWHAIGKSQKSWAEARNGLDKLIREEPDNPQPRIAMANLLARKSETAGQALQLYAELAQRIDVDKDNIRDDWRKLLEETGSRAPAAAREAYARLFPEDATTATAAATPAAPEPVTVTAAEPVAAAQATPTRELIRLAEQRRGESRYAEAAELYLGAAKQDAGNRAQWLEQAQDAQQRAGLKEARRLLAEGNTGEADIRIGQVLGQSPAHADALALMADLHASRNRPADAETLYRRVLADQPQHGAAFEGLLALLQRQQRTEDLIRLAEPRLQQMPDLAPRLAGWLRDAADAEIARQRSSRAMTLLERALALQPANAWVRHDLARLYLRLGLPELGEAVMQEGLALAPDVAMRHAAALVLSSQDHIDIALDMLEAIAPAERTDGIRRLLTSLQVRRLILQAQQAPTRENLLGRAEQLAGDDPELLADVADAAYDPRAPESAITRMGALEARLPSVELSLRMADLLARSGKTAALDGQLQRIAAMPGQSPGQLEHLRNLQVTRRLQQTAALPPRDAEAGLIEALQQHPDHPRLLAALADAKTAMRDFGAAASIQRKRIALNADDLDARIGLAQALREQGERKAAARELDATLVRADPADTDTHRALARQYLALQDAGMARNVATRMLKTDPQDVAALRLAARAEGLSGNSALAAEFLDRAETLAAGEPATLAGIADDWLDLGQSKRGLNLMQAEATREDAGIDMRLKYAELLDRLKLDPELTTELASIAAMAPFPAEVRPVLDRLKSRLAIRTAERLGQEGRIAEARATLQNAGHAQPESLEIRVALAEVEVLSGNYRQAAADFHELLEVNPDRIDLRLDLARNLRLAGDLPAARIELSGALEQAAADDIDSRLSVTRQLLALDDTTAAREVIEPLLTLRPDDPDILLQAGRVEAAGRQYDEAMQLYQQARHFEAADTRDPAAGRTAAERAIAALNERRRYRIEAGMDSEIKRPGDAGISLLTTHEWPVKITIPVGFDGQVFAHADRINLNAGSLDLLDQATADGFGTLASDTTRFVSGKIPHFQSGTMIGLGYENDDWRIDLGTTPREFLVSNLVGGILKTGAIGRIDYRINLSRRAVTGSQLSYAGMRDPVTRKIWGGVTKTGLEVRLSRDMGPLSVSAQAGRFSLDGKNVEDNSESTARLAGDINLIDTEHLRLNLGLSYTRWTYGENLRYYSFGHGGYYSPQYYRSIMLPATWSVRYGRFSGQLRYARHWSRSREDATTLYPLEDGAAPIDGQSGPSKGYSWGWSAEYELAPNLIIGTRVQKDRSGSDYYEPNFWNVYFRYSFDGREAEASGALPDKEQVSLPPYPIRPYSAY